MRIYYLINNRNAILFLVLIFILSGCYQGKENETSTEEDITGFLFRKETNILYSEIIQDSFEIQVSLPA